MFLRSCGPKCAKVRLLPVFDLTQVIPRRLLLSICAHRRHAWVQRQLGLQSRQTALHAACAAQARYDAHHGNFGRGKDTWVLDCRHFCSPVVDVWNQVLFNLMC